MAGSTSIVREIDHLGRIVLPIEMRRTLFIQVGDPLAFFMSEEGIVLSKYSGDACLFCGNLDDVVYYKTKYVCKTCVHQMSLPEAERSTPEAAPKPDFPKAIGPTPKELQIQRITEIRQANPEISQMGIAKQLGISQSRVSQLLKEAGLSSAKARRGRRRHALDRLMQQLRELLSQQPPLKNYEIAAQLGVTPSRVSQLKNKL